MSTSRNCYTPHGGFIATSYSCHLIYLSRGRVAGGGKIAAQILKNGGESLRLGLRADCRCPWLHAKAQEAKRNRQLHLVNPIFLSGTSLRYRTFKAFRISCCRQLARYA